MEFLKDYDCLIQYHPEKANVVTDALSRKNPVLIANIMTWEWELVEAFSQLTVNMVPEITSVYITGLMVHSHIVTCDLGIGFMCQRPRN